MGRVLTLFTAFVALLFVWFGVSPPATSPRQSNEQAASEPGIEPGHGEYPEELTPAALRRLEHWLQKTTAGRRSAPSTRNTFHRTAEPDNAAAPSVQSPPPLGDAPPRLVGFVFSDGQANEADPLAAVRYDGRMWLATVGERIGPYLVHQIIAAEEVTLFNEMSGESLQLFLN